MFGLSGLDPTLQQPRLGWIRFCARLDAEVELEEGFLNDPGGTWGRLANPNALSLADLASEPCVVLLGEPGLGKTIALEQEEARLRAAGGTVDRIDLRGYDTGTDLGTRMFRSQCWQEWQKGSYQLTLILDAVDESPLPSNTLVRVVLDGLRTADLTRLVLRIACRHGAWPPAFEQGLADRFGRTPRELLYKLLPLRMADVKEAATHRGFDGDGFVAEVVRRGVGPLASIPITLDMLLRIYAEGQTLPKMRSEIYRRGLLTLCEEPDVARRHELERGATGLRLTAEQLFRVAARIATYTTLGGHTAISRWGSPHEVSGADFLLSSSAGGNERVGEQQVLVDENALGQSLRTALFVPVGGERYRWGHRTFAEFLSASYLAPRPPEQLRGVVVMADDDGPYITPQLREVAGWLVDLRPELFELLLPSDPFVVLKGAAALGEPARERLVEALLQRFEEVSWDEYWDLWHSFANLHHAGLVTQLTRGAEDRGVSAIRRRVALEIAEQCRLKEMEPLWLRIALDPAESEEVRLEAAGAIVRVGSDDAKARLAPLARGEAGPDPNDELRGLGLRAVWPRHWGAAEVLDHLTPPRNQTLIGVYYGFMQRFPEEVDVSDLPMLLAWTADRLPDEDARRGPARVLLDGVLRRAWESLDASGVPLALARLLVAYVRRYQSWMDEDEPVTEARTRALTQLNRRREFLTVLLNKTDVQPIECYLLNRTSGLLREDDALWVLESAAAAPPGREAAWVECAENAVTPSVSAAVWDRVLQLPSDESPLARAFARWRGAVALDSEDAQQHQTRRAEQAEREAERQRQAEAVAETLTRALERCDRGERRRWLDVMRSLEVDLRGQPEGGDLNRSPTGLARWRAADAATQSRILEAARGYLTDPPDVGTEWIRTSQIPWGPYGTHQAVRLLWELDRPFLDALPPERWPHIAEAIVGFPAWGREPHTALVQFAYSKAPATVLGLLPRLVKEADFLRDLARVWDDLLAGALAELLRSETLPATEFYEVADHLLAHDHQETRRVVETLSSREAPPELTLPVNLPDLLVLLLTHRPEEWDTIWPRLAANPPLALSVLRRLTRRDRSWAQVIDALSEEALGKLYVWLCELVGTTPDEPEPGAMRRVTDEARVARLRDSLPRVVAMRGTRSAIRTLHALAARVPTQAGVLEAAGRTARRAYRLQAWHGLRVAEIRAFLARESRRYVESADELITILMESLERLQQYMQGPLAPVERVWSYDGGGAQRRNFRPKDEEALSDEIARWFDSDLGERGVVVNREVQVRRGQKTDVHVDAIRPGTEGQEAERLTVVIEVKGCWNHDLVRAMESQLVETYLQRSGLTHGIYVVGWFAGGRWDKDWRRDATPKTPLTEIKKRLAQEVERLMAARSMLRLKAVVLDLALRA